MPDRAPSHPAVRPAVAAAADLACLVLFVALGRRNHDIHGGVTWFLGVLWPIALGWFGAALATRLYTDGRRPWVRLTVTWIVGVVVALALRGIVMGHQPFSTFAFVLLGFVGLLTFGWRTIVTLARSRPGRTQPTTR